MNKLVIFDLDGTLIDSLPDIVYYINLMLNKFGFKERTYSEIRNFIGNGARNLVKRSIGEEVSETFLDSCLEYYNQIYTNSGSTKTVIFEGVKNILIDLSKRGYKLAVLTNKPQETTDTIINNLFSFIKFDRVVGFMEGRKCKPDKTEALKLVNDLGVDISDCYFVGDGETDVLTARNSNIKSISVLWGYRDREFLQQYGAEIFASSPKELVRLIK